MLGDIRWQANEQAESLKNSEAALRLYTELLAEELTSAERRLDWIRTHHDIGKALSSNEKFSESIGYFARAIEASEELLKTIARSRRSPDVARELSPSHGELPRLGRETSGGGGRNGELWPFTNRWPPPHPADLLIRNGL